MRIAVVSDIHGNLEAWQSVLEDIRNKAVDAIYCLGDVVGYGADPADCLDSVLENAKILLQGNHEHALLFPWEQRRMNDMARAALVWTWEHLPEGARHSLAQWPMVQVAADARLVHGSPDRPLAFNYITHRLQMENAFRAFSEKFCFCGHTHCPQVIEEIIPRVIRILPLESKCQTAHKETLTFSLRSEGRFLINVGSVGQPRDGDPRARWVMVKSECPDVIFHYVPYNIEKAQRKIVTAGLPKFLAERLQYGK